MSVSFINGHIDGSDRCAICGRDIPEGRQVCVICGYKVEKKKADLVEVVRCKDCKYWGGVVFGYVCRRFSGTYIRNETKENDYCSYGERKGKE